MKLSLVDPSNESIFCGQANQMSGEPVSQIFSASNQQRGKKSVAASMTGSLIGGGTTGAGHK